MPTLPAAARLPWRVSDRASKVNTIANRCFYMIAMGKWLPGTRLPPVRQLESEWSVNRVTILKAYGLLASRGLVRHEPNGSFFVSEQGSTRDFTRDRIELENLYEEIVEKISMETDLSPVGVLRMLTRMAESKMRESPPVAFVECSKSEATDHAQEIMSRFDVPVLPLTLDEIRGKRMRIPSHVRVVFTTSFHIDEIADLREAGTEVVALPIEISAELVAEVARWEREVVFLESDRDLAHRTEKDAVWMMGLKNPRVEVVPDIGGFLKAQLESAGTDRTAAGLPETLYLIAQREWESLDRILQRHTSVRPISCTVSDAAWQMIGDVLRIPFGTAV